MKLLVVGAGYVGLVSAVCFADMGHDVVCIDKDAKKLARLLLGDIPIYEPGLDILVEKNVAAGRLSFSTETAKAAATAECAFIAVGTPQSDTDGSTNLSYVMSAVREIAPLLPKNAVVVIKSTVPVGTGDEVEALIALASPANTLSVASNPEFLREGSAIVDFQEPDRIVIGVEDENARLKLTALYQPMNGKAPLVFTGRRDSELIKYVANAFLAMKVAYINEVASLCEAVGADVSEVAEGIGLDPRIGRRFLMAGPGYGGSCFPKDTLSLAHSARVAGAPLALVEATIASNKGRKAAMAQKILSEIPGSPEGKKVAVWGVTFKANTDDMRDAPALDILPRLKAAGVDVNIHDPIAGHSAQTLFTGMTVHADMYDAAKDASVLVILTEWDLYREPDFAKLKSLMAKLCIVDLRRHLDADAVQSAGFNLVRLGTGQRAVVEQTSRKAEGL